VGRPAVRGDSVVDGAIVADRVGGDKAAEQ
jgi:hypothetical protein